MCAEYVRRLSKSSSNQEFSEAKFLESRIYKEMVS